eukprot:CAMPEP_0116134252 /NCGR_PEP_ID=MMETSP0329-20121206/10546_1 /TAXON_ID=697910 /ORGANISM="Pseudo-nitzschia arenysensis, Strain B593" /LENGTH=197 /DNA_ID=CAMNT_0003628949 /DNA_START=97 /DNA_END=690 /DNA_ORIENTATION=-
MIYYGTEIPNQTVPTLISAPDDKDESESEIIVDSEIKMEKVVDEEDTGVFASIRSKFDKICYSGAVIDEAGTEGQKTVEETAESLMDTLPEKGKKLMEDGAVILQSQSEVMQIKAKEGFAVSMEAIQNFPETFKTNWAKAKLVYERNKRVEAENQKFEEEEAAKRAAAREEAKKAVQMELEAPEDEEKPPVPTVTIP